MKKNNKSVILVVDDKQANILSLESLLADKDTETLHATTGEDALKITFEQHVDLIILDVQMPIMNGFEVAQILKSNKRTKNIPIIFATAESKERKLMMQGYDEGAVDYLFKPLDPEIVKAKVTVLLKIQQQKRELVEKNASLQKSELLISNSADIIGIIDAATLVIEEINNAFTVILGYTASEVKENTLLNFITDEDKLLLAQLSSETKEHLSFSIRMNCKDNNIKWLDWKVVVKNGKWFINARDITEVVEGAEKIKQLNANLHKNVLQLESTNKELESFSYSVSHDLRAPLRALNIYSQIIQDEHMDNLNEEVQKMIGKIQFNTRKMGTLIDDLLEFSRLGRQDVKKMKIDTQNMVKAVIEEIGHTTKHHATIETGILPPVYADNNLIQQVWINLISNAVKYSTKKEMPAIIIGSKTSPTETTFFVTDNGSGFDMKYAAKLFGVFQRLHSTQEFEGTGVGLAIVNRIITKHGGKVWAEAKKDEGASFYFTLPNE